MRFGVLPITGAERAEAEGAILAHTLRADGVVLKKGHRLGAEDLVRLAAAGYDSVMAARLESGDVGEDVAAEALARALAGPGVRVAPAKTGRANLYAAAHGIWEIDGSRVDAINGVDEALTVATLAPMTPVRPGEMVATVKVIPFAVALETLGRTLDRAGRGAASVRAFRVSRVGLVLTRLDGQPPARLEQGARAVGDRVRALGGTIVRELRCAHAVAPVAAALGELLALALDLVLVLGASAIVDRRDVIPAGIVASGGLVEHFGMPVDPGNLILLARHGGRPILGVPSCARSPKRSGFDMVLERVAAGLPWGRTEVMRLGVGGLLPDIPSRPGPREAVEDESRRPRVAGLLLAAGSSRRMGSRHKLLVPIEGRAMVARAAEVLCAAGLSEVVVVTGDRAEEVQAALGDLPVRFVHNPDHQSGLASSLKAGLQALGPDIDGALVALGDMPWVKPETIGALTDAFALSAAGAICAPFVGGKRGNPVLWARRYFPEILGLSGDSGARELLARHADAVRQVEVDDPGVLWDVDTEEALLALLQSQRVR